MEGNMGGLSNTDNFSVYIQMMSFFISLLTLPALSIISKPRRKKKKEKGSWNVVFSGSICRQSTARRLACTQVLNSSSICSGKEVFCSCL